VYINHVGIKSCKVNPNKFNIFAKIKIMFSKGSKLYSIFTGKCPQCHQESMYESNNLYNPSKIIKMNEKCSHCGLKFQIEPSFFYGAMYVNYGVSVACGIAAFIIAFGIFKLTLIQTFIAICITLFTLFPFILRISRNIWINFFVKYKGK
jgi:uncharacterized protein (DUF983 family)